MLTFSLKDAGIYGRDQDRRVALIYSPGEVDPSQFAVFSQKRFIRVCYLNDAMLDYVLSGGKLEHEAGQEGLGLEIGRL